MADLVWSIRATCNGVHVVVFFETDRAIHDAICQGVIHTRMKNHFNFFKNPLDSFLKKNVSPRKNSVFFLPRKDFTTLRPVGRCSREKSGFDKTNSWRTVDFDLKDVVLEVKCPR